MRSYSFSCLGLAVALTLACDSKGNDSDTSDINTGSGTEGDGTEGASSSDGSATGDPQTSVSSGGTTTGADPTATATDPTATATSSEPNPTGQEPGTSTSTTGPDPSGTASNGPSSDVTTDEPPPEPTPCEGEAVELDVAKLAYTYAQLPPAPDPTGGSSGTTGGDPVDPDTVYVRLANQAATCSDPSPGLDCGPNWEVSIRLPPAFQTPGLYHLAGADVTGIAMETGAGQGGDCSFGGGTFSATFQLISIDENEVVGRLCHVENFFFENTVDLEGSFTAPRCQ
jgi:hypothetical protein